MKLMANHTATHLLNFALNKVVGESSMQKGSKVDGDKFTFDFYTTNAVDTSLVQMVEETINIIIGIWSRLRLQLDTFVVQAYAMKVNQSFHIDE